MGGRTDREERFELCRAKRRSEKTRQSALRFLASVFNFFDFKESLLGPRRPKKKKN